MEPKAREATVRARPGRLRVLSWRGGWGRALRTAVSIPFERATGVAVEHVPHVGLKLPSALLDALARGMPPPVDVVWSNAVPALRAARLGFARPLDVTQDRVFDALRTRAWPAPALLPTRLRSVVHPYVVYYVLAYDERASGGRPPRSWRTLLEPRHRGKVALYPGGNGFYPIAQVMGGGHLTDFPDDARACWSFVRKLRRQIGALDYSIGMEEQLRSGRLSLCFRALTNALAFRAAGLPVSFSVPEEGTTDALDALWLPRGLSSETAALAQRYVAFALTPAVQTHWCAELGAMPVHPQAVVPTILRGRDDLPKDADDQRGILSLAEEVKVLHEHEWEARFAAELAAG